MAESVELNREWMQAIEDITYLLKKKKRLTT